MNREDKIKIAARLFFADNNDYASYQEAVDEMTVNNLPDGFLDNCLEPITRHVEPGYRLLMNDVGHVISVNNDTGHVLPATQQSEIEADLYETAARAEAARDSSVSVVRLMQNVGWRLI